MNKLYTMLGKVIVSYVVIDAACKLTTTLVKHYTDSKIKQCLKEGRYVDIDGRIYKVEVEKG